MGPKKRCCRSAPRCRDCPVGVARELRRAQVDAGAPAVLFDEIYGRRAGAVPESVAQALVALTHARPSRRRAARERVKA